MTASLTCHEKFGPGQKLVWADQNWKPKLSLLAKNGPPARAGFRSIVEAIGFPNRRHQHSVVSEREQQESDVLKKAYTRGREQQKNRLPM